jgi:glutathione S-transferase
MPLRIAGRSSAHFTRVARIFAHELGVEYELVPVRDLLSQTVSDYLGNPALRVPVLQTESGVWFGALNACRELARLAPRRLAIVWPEHSTDPDGANAQELVLQGMSTEVGMIMRAVAAPHVEAGGDAAPLPDLYADKNRRSLGNSLAWLETKLPGVLQRLPADRALSFLEVSAFCFLEHLEFREVFDTSEYLELRTFCRAFGERASARATAYRFDVV